MSLRPPEKHVPNPHTISVPSCPCGIARFFSTARRRDRVIPPAHYKPGAPFPVAAPCQDLHTASSSSCMNDSMCERSYRMFLRSACVSGT